MTLGKSVASEGDSSRSWADTEVFESSDTDGNPVLALGLVGGVGLAFGTGSGSVGSMGGGRVRFGATS